MADVKLNWEGLLQMPYTTLLAISMAVALFSGICSKYFIERYQQSDYTIHFFNTVSAAISVIILIIWNWSFRISWFTFILGLAFGGITTIQRIFSMKAMKIGPWSYTAVIASLSTIIPTMSGAVIWNEHISFIQIAGIVLMVVCICLSSDLKKDSSKKSARWILYCAIVFVMTGSIGVLQKFHQSTQYQGELNEFLIVALTTSCLCSLVCTVKTRTNTASKKSTDRMLSPIPLGLMLVSGIGIAVNNRLNLFLSGVLDSSFMFPIVNGGGLMLTTLTATLLFKERLSKKQWIGLALGAIAVILLCNPF